MPSSAPPETKMPKVKGRKVVDESDPDLDEPQIQHLLQLAEAIRKDYPNEDWLHLAALIHDLGKILLLPKFGGLPQWAVVGDTFPLGCAFDEANVHHKMYFKENPDYKNPAYASKNGIYKEKCGLDNLVISWGHDDYMYMVAKKNNNFTSTCFVHCQIPFILSSSQTRSIHTLYE
ncbi:hypothetical protein L6164_033160 [Bauhinia variegata]|uniref:Uncharacterized protein n=1 Tax=Bauhinia variegata TaxID=167791 RepID=A0ACB9KR39_BAUVA|nr:hypothetical protein L6164_033160 [Bauhinia variegata]